MTIALDIDSLTVELGGRHVVRNLTVAVADGEWLALIGPNGAGKTTALRAVAGLVPYRGSVRIADMEVATLGRRELARAVAVVPQTPATPSALTVAEYVALGRTPHLSYLGRESARDLAAARRAVRRLDLELLAERTLGSLSGGERQRAVLARALTQDAPLLLLDEPTTSLDLGRQQSVLELVDCLRRELSLTVVGAMHDLTLAGQYADRLLLLSGGAAVARGRPPDVLTEWTISEHYRATVDVVRGATPAVVPRRADTPQETRWQR